MASESGTESQENDEVSHISNLISNIIDELKTPNDDSSGRTEQSLDELTAMFFSGRQNDHVPGIRKPTEELRKTSLTEAESTKKIEQQIIYSGIQYMIDVHKDQERNTGGPYGAHPYMVALNTARFLDYLPQLDLSMAIAGLLHDAIEEPADKEIKDMLNREYYMLPSINKKMKDDSVVRQLAIARKSKVKEIYSKYKEDLRINLQEIVEYTLDDQQISESMTPEIKDKYRESVSDVVDICDSVTRRIYSNYFHSIERIVGRIDISTQNKVRGMLLKIMDGTNNLTNLDKRESPSERGEKGYSILKPTEPEVLMNLYEESLESSPVKMLAAQAKVYALFAKNRLIHVLIEDLPRVLQETARRLPFLRNYTLKSYNPYSNLERIKTNSKIHVILNEAREFELSGRTITKLLDSVNEEASSVTSKSDYTGNKVMKTREDVFALMRYMTKKGGLIRDFGTLSTLIKTNNEQFRQDVKRAMDLGSVLMSIKDYNYTRYKGAIEDYNTALENLNEKGPMYLSNFSDISRLISDRKMKRYFKNEHIGLAYKAHLLHLWLSKYGYGEKDDIRQTAKDLEDHIKRYNIKEATKELAETAEDVADDCKRHYAKYHFMPAKINKDKKELDDYRDLCLGLEGVTECLPAEKGGSRYDGIMRKTVVPWLTKAKVSRKDWFYETIERIIGVAKEENLMANDALKEMFAKYQEDDKYYLKGVEFDHKKEFDLGVYLKKNSFWGQR
jgi:hypothetical protein